METIDRRSFLKGTLALAGGAMLAKGVSGIGKALSPTYSQLSDDNITYDYELIHQPALERVAFYERGRVGGFLSLASLGVIYSQREEALMACEVCELPPEPNEISSAFAQSFLPLVAASSPSLADLTLDMPAMLVSCLTDRFYQR